MMKPITGQYECAHTSGVGLDYFTSRIDRLTLQPNGRFTLVVQDRSRLANAAQSFISGQQVNSAAPETRREGHFTQQGNTLTLHFDDGTQEHGQLAWNGEGVQMGQNFFNKVSDSTLLPPTNRLKKDMDDIAKGLKIAGAIGGFAMKAAKTIQDGMQSTQGPSVGPNTPSTQGQPPAQQPQQQTPYRPPAQPVQQAPMPQQPPAHTPQPDPPIQQTPQTAQPPAGYVDAIFCDQCGARARPGKKFCNQCGSPLL